MSKRESLQMISGSPQRPWKTFAVILQACPRCFGISKGSYQSAGPNYMPTRHVKHIILQQTCSHGHFRSFIPKMKLFVKKASEKGEILQMSWITSTTQKIFSKHHSNPSNVFETYQRSIAIRRSKLFAHTTRQTDFIATIVVICSFFTFHTQNKAAFKQF